MNSKESKSDIDERLIYAEPQHVVYHDSLNIKINYLEGSYQYST